MEKSQGSIIVNSLADILTSFSLDVIGVVVSYLLCGTAKADKQPQHLLTLPALEKTCTSISCLDNGNMYICHGNVIQTVDCDGQCSNPILSGVTNRIKYMAIGHDSIYITCLGVHDIRVHRLNGEFVRSLGGREWCNDPTGMVMNKDGSSLFVLDAGRRRVVVFNQDGQYIRAWDMYGARRGWLQHPVGIALNDNQVVVSDTFNHRVQIFDQQGTLLRIFGSTGVKPGQLVYPRGVAIDRLGQVLVCDSGNDRVQVFQPDGTFITQFGKQEGMAHFKSPYAICVDDVGRIWVSTWEQPTIHVFGFPLSAIVLGTSTLSTMPTCEAQ